MKKLLATFALVGLTVGLAACSPSADDGIANDGCTPIVVATSSEKVNLMEELGTKFKDSAEHKGLDGCATVVASNVASGKAAELLNQSTAEWRGTTPAPSVWSPASTTWTDNVASIAGEKVVAGAESFARTPIVFGMPESMATALGYPDRDISIQEIHDLIASPEGWGSQGKALWGSFKIAKTNPNTSTTGLSTILMQSYAASGKQKDLTVDDVTAAEDFSRVFESGAIHYGDTTGKVLQNLADNASGSGSSYVSAIALEETSLYNYNIGNPDSHTVQPGETLTPPEEKLVAIYPSEGSMWSDNPAVVLNASWVKPDEKAAAEAFVKFLHTKAAQETLPSYGFRTIDDSVDVSDKLNGTVGIDASKPAVTLPKPDPAVVSAAIDQWAQIRKPSAILQLIDISGSMDDSIGNGKSKLTAAIEAAQGTLEDVRPTDEIGVWAFTTGLASTIDGKNSNVAVEVRPFGELGDAKESLKSDIGDLTHTNRQGTPLYDAVDTAYSYMKNHAETGRINAIVVISDGADTDSSSSVNSLIQRIKADQGEGVNTDAVKIFAIGFGDGADMESLEKLAKASGGQVFDATDPERLNEVFQSVMRNF